jgi:AcrR family transcriptional regulator
VRVSDPESKRGRGRPRRTDADDLILGAAATLLGETGFAAFSVDTIAERSGIAKTTIYRRWPTKAALVANVLEVRIPMRGETARSLLEEIADAVRLLGNADASAAEVLVSFIRMRRDRLASLIESDLADVLADAVTGAMLLRFASGRSEEAVRPEILERLARLAQV